MLARVWVPFAGQNLADPTLVYAEVRRDMMLKVTLKSAGPNLNGIMQGQPLARFSGIGHADVVPFGMPRSGLTAESALCSIHARWPSHPPDRGGYR